MKKLIAGITAAGLLTFGAVGSAAATPDNATDPGRSPAVTGRHGRHHPRVALFIAGHAAAEALGMSVPDLRDALRGGQSIAEVAESKGTDLATVESAIVTALTDALHRAVERGRIDGERAAKIEERIPTFVDRIVQHTPGQHGAAGTGHGQAGGTGQTTL
jgi:hypothetical protein